MQTPDAILIDFYGTICSGDRRAVQEACLNVVERLNLSVTPTDLATRWGERFFATIEKSNGSSFKTLRECEAQSLRETLASMDQRAGQELDIDALVAPLEAYWRDPPIYADAIQFLSRVKQPICCVSNADHEPLMAAIEKHGLQFEAVITSERTRSYKPDARIFETALRALSVTAPHVMHIGDSLHSDVAGANAVGIPTVWVCRDDRIHDIGVAKASATVSMLDEILPLLA